MPDEVPRRYRTYKIRFDEKHGADGLRVLATKTRDEFHHVDKDTFIINGDQLAVLDQEKIPYEILKQPPQPTRWGPLGIYRLVTVQFESREQRKLAIELFYKDKELRGVPRLPLIGNNVTLLPKEAVPLLEKKGIRFTVLPPPQRRDGLFQLKPDDAHE